MTALRLHFDAWAGDDAKGDALGELTQATDKVYRDEFNGMPSGQFVINRHDLQSQYAATGNLIRVRLVDGGPFDWDDPRYIGAFWIEEGKDVLVSTDEEGGETYDKGGRGVIAYLENAVVQDKAYSTGSGKPRASSGYWYWNAGPYGQMFNRLMNEVRARWSNTYYLIENFGDTHDSDGGLFESFTGQFRIDIGQNYLDVVNTLRDLGIQFGANAAFVLQAWADHGVDHTADVTFQKGVNIREADEREIHASPYKSRVLVRGTVGTKIAYRTVVHSPSLETVAASDRREGYTEYAKTASLATLDKVGRKYLGSLLGDKEGPQTMGVTTGDGTEAADGHYVPWTDYNPGDTVLLEIPGEYNGVAKVIGAVVVHDGEAGLAETIVEFSEGTYGGGGVASPPSPDDPYVPPTTHGYKGAVIADGAIHAWAYDEASGNVLDYVDTVAGVPTVSGANPVRQVSGPPLIVDSKAWRLDRSDSSGTVAVAPDNDGSDFPSGNADWTVEWWHRWASPFFGQETVFLWGGAHSLEVDVFSTFGNGHTGPAVQVIVGSVTLTDLGSGAGVCPLDGVSTNGSWHDYMVVYTGADRTYKVYLDGELQGSMTGDADLDLDPPNSGARLLDFAVLETFGFGWQSIYPSALTAAQAANHALGDGALISGAEGDIPAHGQRVGPESWVSDGSTTDLQTMFPYAERSLSVTINGLPVVVEETQDDAQTDGAFRLPAPTAAGNIVTWYYTATGGEATGASNPVPGTPPPGTVPTDPGQVLGGDGTYRPPSQLSIPTETPDGSRTVFTIPPYVANTTLVYVNGLIQRRGTDYTESNPGTGAITFTDPPIATDELLVVSMPLIAPPPSSGGARPVSWPRPVTTGTAVLPGTIDQTGATEVGAAVDAWIATVPDHMVLDFNGATLKMHQGLQLPPGRNHLVLDGLTAGRCSILADATASASDQLSSQIILGHRRGGSWGLGGGDIWIRGFHLTGNDSSPGTFTSGQEAQANLEITGYSRVEIDDVIGEAAPGDFLFIEDVTGLWAHSLHAPTAGRDGVSMISGRDILIEDYAFDVCGQNTFDIEPNTAAQACYNFHSRNGTGATYGNAFLGIEGSHTGAPIHGMRFENHHQTTGGLLSIIDNGGTSRMTDIAILNSEGTASLAGPVIIIRHVDGATITGITQPLSSGSLISQTDVNQLVTD